jgi:hypothetical protein
MLDCAPIILGRMVGVNHSSKIQLLLEIGETFKNKKHMGKTWAISLLEIRFLAFYMEM